MTNVIPFGKYRGVDVDTVFLNDPQYLDWLLNQPRFAEQHGQLANAIRLLVAADAPMTPQHNAMQARFLDLNFCNAFLRAVGHPTVGMLPQFEQHGVDVLFPTVGVELKPAVGDDYPAVMRQILGRQRVYTELRWRQDNYPYTSKHLTMPAHIPLFRVALVYGEFTATNLIEAQVCEMMRCSGIIPCSLDQITAQQAQMVIDNL